MLRQIRGREWQMRVIPSRDGLSGMILKLWRNRSKTHILDLFSLCMWLSSRLDSPIPDSLYLDSRKR